MVRDPGARFAGDVHRHFDFVCGQSSLGIIGVGAVSTLRHVHPDMTIAYRHIALPAAVVAGSIIFVLALVMEIRHYRQAKTLANIERVAKYAPQVAPTHCHPLAPFQRS